MPNIKRINRQLATWQIIETSPHASCKCKEDRWCTNFDLLSPADVRKRPISAVYRARLFRADYQRGMFVALLVTALYESWRQNYFAVVSLRGALSAAVGVMIATRWTLGRPYW